MLQQEFVDDVAHKVSWEYLHSIVTRLRRQDCKAAFSTWALVATSWWLRLQLLTEISMHTN